MLVWTPGKGSPIHDHGNAHCIMKILHGSLTESRYEFPNSDKEQPMELIRQTTYQENKVAYMADELGLHKMENKGKDYAISLHCRFHYPFLSLVCEAGNDCCPPELTENEQCTLLPMSQNQDATPSTLSRVSGAMSQSVGITPSSPRRFRGMCPQI